MGTASMGTSMVSNQVTQVELGSPNINEVSRQRVELEEIEKCHSDAGPVTGNFARNVARGFTLLTPTQKRSTAPSMSNI